MNSTKSKIKLTPRSRVRLTEGEMATLKKYILDNNAAYATITANSGVKRDTVVATIERGWIEFKAAVKLRDFIKVIS